MALSEAQRQLLILAREYLIEHPNNTYLDNGICNALEAVDDTVQDGYQAGYQLRVYLQNALRPWILLENWQKHNNCYVSQAQTCLDRLAWIDWML